MSSYVGSVRVDAISSVESGEGVTQEEIDFIDRDASVLLVEDDASEDLKINVIFHDDADRTADAKREDLKSLLEHSPSNTHFVYQEWEGFLSVDNIDYPRSSESGVIREASIDARYLDWPEYNPNSRPMDGGDYGHGIYGDYTYGE